ncbi:MAG TPA: hypothetical protein VHP83_22380 [Aggregatilineaceae bacterium]|nr:hypothetical protein [Aggregatilineaceae bacterium]
MDIQTQLTLLDETVAHFVAIFQDGADPEMMVYEEWNAKDVLGHITFWHESFARNVSDLVHDIKPSPLKGTFSTLNQQCMEEMRRPIRRYNGTFSTPSSCSSPTAREPEIIHRKNTSILSTITSRLI